MNIRPYEKNDVNAICDIYNHYINNSSITFEDIPISVTEMSRRIESCTKLYPCLVCEVNKEIVGYAYASQWKTRSAYKNTIELTIYLKQSVQRKGYGKALFSALLTQLNSMSCHVILSCIALPNDASEKLHEHFGFKKVAHFSEVGCKFGQWLDVVYWQKINNFTDNTA